VEFAKELFSIWDENDSGKLDLEDLTLPLIALGLVNETSFVSKTLMSIKGKNRVKGLTENASLPQ
jgi:Ca2+-binding EF-hand superfamily protein